ncbi:hypothetical protein HETIRDRAFT_330914, partial [Heterobasidion irregulare TC 32-1]
LSSVGQGPTVFGKSWRLWYLLSAVRYLPKASRIPSLDPSMGACSSMLTIRPTSLKHSFEPVTPSPITLANNVFSPTFDFLTMATPSMPARGN